ncbi:MAG: phage holin family protein [Candidatus Cloacimonadota bacterium]|nr:phage holin family protein [Candidatus Cloacimonadota bacterium]
MQDVILKFLILSFSIYTVGRLTGLFVIDNFFAAIVAALVLALVNITIKPVLDFISFPITFITFGLFTFFVNGFCLLIVSKFVPKFKLRGCFTAAIAAFLITLVNSLLTKLIF